MSRSNKDILREAEENNLLWLKSFGCEIVRKSNITEVFHPDMPGYRAVMVSGSPEASIEPLKTAIDENSTRLLPYTIYLDNASSGPAHVSLLRKSGYRPVMINQTLALTISHETGTVDVEIASVTSNDIEQWSSLYSEGFERAGDEATVDQKRWKTAFTTSEHVFFWFLKMGIEIIGICQTCVGCGIVGVYSLAIRPSLRGKGHGRRSWKAVTNKIVREGGNHIYYDRLIIQADRDRRDIGKLTPGVDVIREYRGFSRR